MREVEIAVDEKELQKEAALKEKEKELQQLRSQIDDTNQRLQNREKLSSQTKQEQAGLAAVLRGDLNKTVAEKQGKCDTATPRKYAYPPCGHLDFLARQHARLSFFRALAGGGCIRTTPGSEISF